MPLLGVLVELGIIFYVDIGFGVVVKSGVVDAPTRDYDDGSFEGVI